MLILITAKVKRGPSVCIQVIHSLKPFVQWPTVETVSPYSKLFIVNVLGRPRPRLWIRTTPPRCLVLSVVQVLKLWARLQLIIMTITEVSRPFYVDRVTEGIGAGISNGPIVLI